MPRPLRAGVAATCPGPAGARLLRAQPRRAGQDRPPALCCCHRVAPGRADSDDPPSPPRVGPRPRAVRAPGPSRSDRNRDQHPLAPPTRSPAPQRGSRPPAPGACDHDARRRHGAGASKVRTGGAPAESDAAFRLMPAPGLQAGRSTGRAMPAGSVSSAAGSAAGAFLLRLGPFWSALRLPTGTVRLRCTVFQWAPKPSSGFSPDVRKMPTAVHTARAHVICHMQAQVPLAHSGAAAGVTAMCQCQWPRREQRCGCYRCHREISSRRHWAQANRHCTASPSP